MANDEQKDKDKNEDKPKAQDKSQTEKKTGIDPKQLLKAPSEPPDIKDKRPPTEKQKSTFIMGLFVILAGFLLYPLIGIYASAFVVLVGLGVIVYSVIFRIEDKKQ